MGAALNLALACDLIVKSDDAPSPRSLARRGLSIDGGGSWILPRVVGIHRMKLALLADIIRLGGRAHRAGQPGRPRSDLDVTAAALAARLAAWSTLALGITERLLNQSARVTLPQALEPKPRRRPWTCRRATRPRRWWPSSKAATLSSKGVRSSASSRPFYVVFRGFLG